MIFERVEMANGALDAALRGAKLTKRLLAVARQQPLSARVIDLNERLPGMSAMLQRTLGEDIQSVHPSPPACDRRGPVLRRSKTPFSIWRSTPATRCRTAVL